ncbi:MAG: DUF4886 domain-containing protein [Verrucomicrobiales bacterium]|nr:DUF4886 domain-containing protein [Verrucomicrobiales bacterium]
MNPLSLLKRWSLFLAAFLVLGSIGVHGQAADSESKTIRVLTVGNSFADNALTYLKDLAEAAGHTLIAGKANLGGCTFERHWRHVAAYQEDPESEEGSPYGKGKYSLDDMLKKEPWDIITIQQVSYRSHDLSTYYPYARDLYNYIKARAPDAQIFAHQIWAYRVDDPRFVPKNEGKEPHTQKVMYEQVRKSYHTLIDELNLDGILPSGDAMYLADTNSEWGFVPDPDLDIASFEHPNTPTQEHSLHVGWRWREKDGTRQLTIDGHHASEAGKYLIGCVWYETLFGVDVTNNTFVPKGIAPEYAKFLRATAHQAVSQLEK